MKQIISIAILAVLPALTFAANRKVALSEGLSDKTISMDAVNFVGGYQGKTTRLSLTNNSKSAVEVKVNLGVILKPEDSSYQPMVLAGEETIIVLAHGTAQVDVQTFCGNAPRSCPRQDLHYKFSCVGNDTLIKVLQFIRTNSLFDGLGQSAVWAMTNDHNALGVYDPNRDALSKKLIDVICAATGWAKPEYHRVAAIEQVPDQPAYVPKNLKIYAEFEIILNAPKTMTLGVFDSSGNMAQPVFENKEFPKAGHRFNVEFEAENVPAGKYYIRLKEGDAILQEKMVKVE